MYEICISTYFAAAHYLRGYEGACENIHGHNWNVEVIVRTEKLNSIGLGIDFKNLKKVTDETLARVDHLDINQVPPFDKINPSSENLAKWVFEETGKRLNSDTLRVHRVNIRETDFFTASYFEER